jgi:predicted regulator of Ras-like GTPase activity (Roadblock/LC7/MglB family)
VAPPAATPEPTVEAAVPAASETDAAPPPPTTADEEKTEKIEEKIEEKPEEKASVRPLRTPLQVALNTNEKLDAKGVVALVNKMPGVKACAILFGDGLSLAGSLPAELETDGICAMAPALMQRIENHVVDTKLGLLRGMTLACATGAITFYMHENLCLAALHAELDLPNETREKLSRVVHELPKILPPHLSCAMSIINYAGREIQFKIVYCRRRSVGRRRISATSTNGLIPKTAAARLARDRRRPHLFFDFLPLNAVVIKGFVTKFQLYTVCSQVIYNATRQPFCAAWTG